MVIEQSEVESDISPAPEDGNAEIAALEAPPAEHAALRVSDSAARLLRLRVPVVVVLASRRMPVGQVRALSPGGIIEFAKPLGTPLDLCVNNHPIGRGTCVKVGENFGLRIEEIESKADRIQSLAK